MSKIWILELLLCRLSIPSFLKTLFVYSFVGGSELSSSPFIPSLLTRPCTGWYINATRIAPSHANHPHDTIAVRFYQYLSISFCGENHQFVFVDKLIWPSGWLKCASSCIVGVCVASVGDVCVAGDGVADVRMSATMKYRTWGRPWAAVL